MIDKIGTVCIFVSDQQRAKEFYTDVLGFELRQDAPLYPGSASRWISVAPSGAQTEAVLYLPDENWEHYRQVVGKSQAVTFTVSDLDNTYAELKAKDVKFAQEPSKEPWGTFAQIEDSEGNTILLMEEPKA